MAVYCKAYMNITNSQFKKSSHDVVEQVKDEQRLMTNRHKVMY